LQRMFRVSPWRARSNNGNINDRPLVKPPTGSGVSARVACVSLSEKRRSLFECFPYVCPEHVLVNDRFDTKWGKRCIFLPAPAILLPAYVKAAATVGSLSHLAVVPLPRGLCQRIDLRKTPLFSTFPMFVPSLSW
jgi:hypothetical protein